MISVILGSCYEATLIFVDVFIFLLRVVIITHWMLFKQGETSYSYMTAKTDLRLVEGVYQLDPTTVTIPRSLLCKLINQILLVQPIFTNTFVSWGLTRCDILCP